jgi:glutamate carboxypeptidase
MKFDPRGLPFDCDSMLAGLKSWVECESPTYDSGAVNRMMDLVARDLALAGALVERIPGRMGFGDCVRARFPHPREHEPGVLVMGHFDTVHPVGTLGPLPFRRDGELCYGPGICDMKGGNFLSLEAVRQLQRASIRSPLPIAFLFTGDEEVGTPSARDLVEAEASRAKYVLIPEPGRADNGVVTGRYAIARFALQTTGRPSHAGARLADGRSAIREMARRIVEIEEMTTPDCTFSVGVVNGGQWVNCVATTCNAQVLSMAKRQHDLDAGVARLLALNGTRDDVGFKVEQTVTRPVWEPDEKSLALYVRAKNLAKELGQDLPHESAGGGSDGNFTGAMGIPTLDGLGVIGAGIHTLNEHIRVQSLVDRGRLMAALLATLD